MSIQSDLRKDGIEVVKKLDTLKVNSIARNVSIKLCQTFSELNLDQNDLFSKLSRLDMYIAKMPEGMAEASYLFRNSSIYFNEHINPKNLEDYAIHECIHAIQEVKDKKNYLLRMGLCDYKEFKVYGMGLNEASVQLMASKVLSTPKEYVKYFGISFETNSPDYYPIECCLANQLSYIVGEDVLFDSTINSNDNFKNKIIEKTNYKTFMKIQSNIDKILQAEENIVILNNKIIKIDDRNKKVDTLIEKIDNLKKDIASIFIKTQNLIVTSVFDKEFDSLNKIEQLDEFRQRLYSFKDCLGAIEGYTFFNDYYVNKMMQLEDKYTFLENYNPETSIYLAERRASKISIFFRTLKNILLKSSTEESYAKDSYSNDK